MKRANAGHNESTFPHGIRRRMTSSQDPQWLTFTLMYLVPVISGIAAILAAWFSGRALVYIKRQIELGREQIEIANKQISLGNQQIGLANTQIAEAQAQTVVAQSALDLARLEFDATIETLKITRVQSSLADEQRAKLPSLSVEFKLVAKVMVEGTTLTYNNSVSPLHFGTDMYVVNKGKLDATTVIIHLRLSPGIKFENHHALAAPSTVRDSNQHSAAYVVGATVQNDGLPVFVGRPGFTAEWGEYDVWWRVESNEGSWPVSAEEPMNEWGQLHIKLGSALPGR